MHRPLLLRLCRAYRTTSNAALQVLAGIMPLHLKVKILTWTWTLDNILITTENLNKLTKYADIGCLSNLDWDLLNTFEQEGNFKKKTNYAHPARNKNVFITDMYDNPFPMHFIFTDGSKSGENVGASFVHSIHGNADFKYTAGFKLANYCTVPEAELFAIYRALVYIRDLKNHKGHVRICTDSQTALQKIIGYKKQCHTTSLIHEVLQAVRNFKVSFAWIRGHSGVQGNEQADRIAKQHAKKTGKIIYPQLTYNNIRTLIENTATLLWQAEWCKGETGRVTFEFLPNVLERLRTKHLELNSAITQTLTGQGNFKYYLHRFGHSEDDICECDGSSVQNVEHFIFQCNMYDRNRTRLIYKTLKHGHNWPCPLRCLVSNGELFKELTTFITETRALEPSFT
ncbi:uncharacterized protein [Centruroides vittatus]|uniref:uncharacterized protein n=1 Tax=Centruroides vittatus TaxID=120091 RepID=UPI00350F6D40